MDQLLSLGRPILEPLVQAGYPAYFVGGSVRDVLLHRTIHDLDVATVALPQETKAVFAPLATVDTGIHHGTITLLSPQGPVEITTFRREGTYSDHRRPDTVSFTTQLEEDLSRRDFTMNALALGLDGLHDPFGGMEDIQNGIIRCVGDPDCRFQEDGLRILRALRFASTLGFSIESRTAAAIHRWAHLLSYVSMERISSELLSLLCGDHAADILLEYSDVAAIIIPELAPTMGFIQHNPHHSYDVYTHSLRTLSWVRPVPTMRLAALLHDIAKPQTFHVDQNGVGHFYGHAKIGAPVAKEIMQRLKLSNALIEAVLPLIANHGLTRDTPIPKLPKLISRLGEENFFNLLDLDRADSSAKHRHSSPEDGNWDEISAAAQEFLSREPCLTVKDLMVNGRDAMDKGLQGPAIGLALNALLDQVLDGTLENRREVLLTALASH